jgi:plasmid stabilization system protein ParE
MPRAEVDLDEILRYFSRFYASTPLKFLKEYNSELDILSFFPEMHKKWDVNNDYHVFYVRYYAVLHTIDHDTQTVWIHRIINAKRKLSPNIEVMEEQTPYETLSNNNMEGTNPTVLEDTPPLRGVPYPTF